MPARCPLAVARYAEQGQTAQVDITGRVLVVAGDDPILDDVVRVATDAGGRVAVVSAALSGDAATVRFRAAADDPAVWERVAMHVEQHLGPIDGVIADGNCLTTVTQVFEADLRRRRHGAVVVADATADPSALVSHAVGTPPAARSQPVDDGPER